MNLESLELQDKGFKEHSRIREVLAGEQYLRQTAGVIMKGKTGGLYARISFALLAF